MKHRQTNIRHCLIHYERNKSMKTPRHLNLFLLFVILTTSLILRIQETSARSLLNKSYHSLASGPLIQNWSDEGLITINNDWSGVPSIEGYRGEDLTNTIDTDPQTILDPNDMGALHVNPSVKVSPSSYTYFGVAEFDYQIKSIALGASGIADAPHLKIYVNSLTCSDIRVKYKVKDIEDSADNSVQQVALHYRTNGSGKFINVPSAYIEDATLQNSATKVTEIDIILPETANNQSFLEIRIMTTNAENMDEWIGIDDIEISGTCVDPYKEPIIPDCPEEIQLYEGSEFNTQFSASDQDGIVSQASIEGTAIPGIQITNLVPATISGGQLVGILSTGKDTPGGNHEIEILFTNNDPTPQTASCIIPIMVIPKICPTPDTHEIGEIQGEKLISPFYNYSGITISGNVTAKFFEGGINGFFIQDINGDNNNFTSDGIFIRTTNHSVEIGQPVQITGTVNEFFDRTEIINVSDLKLCGTQSITTPISLSLPVITLTDFEKYEGMLVEFSNELYINGTHDFDRYGEVVLGSQPHINPTSLFPPGSVEYEQMKNSYSLDQIILDDGQLTYNPNPTRHPNGIDFSLENFFRSRDVLTNVTGILDYAYGKYRLQPIEGAIYFNTNSRPSKPDEVGGTIRVASFNVLNYFTTLNSRGAENETEFTRQHDKLISTITKLDADILGLVEIENNTIAIQNLVDGLNLANGEEIYTFIETGIIGIDEIKVAIIYKPGSVTPIGSHAILDSTIDNRFLDEKNRPSLAQTFLDPINNKNFTVIVNHFKSRSSACDDINDPNLNDGSGNCNLTRKSASEALIDWIASDPTGSGSNNFLIIGDLNSYSKEEPIQEILSGSDDKLSTIDDYTNLVQKFNGEDAYTYVFDSQFGYLDHAFASTFLSRRVTGTTIWHINADESDLLDYNLTYKDPLLYSPDEYRSSDHDPIIIGLDFSDSIPPIAESNENYTGIEDESIEISLEAIDESNRSLTFRIVSDPSFGSLQLSSNLVTYTPNSNYSGLDTFKFVANNGIEDSNQATISINIQPVNDLPVAQDDYFEINENELLQVPASGVLINDYDIENDVLSAFLVKSPSQGDLVLSLDGSFSYLPPTDFIGDIEFSYKVFDGKEYSSEAVVKIKVNPTSLYFEHKVFVPLISR